MVIVREDKRNPEIGRKMGNLGTRYDIIISVLFILTA